MRVYHAQAHKKRAKVRSSGFELCGRRFLDVIAFKSMAGLAKMLEAALKFGCRFREKNPIYIQTPEQSSGFVMADASRDISVDRRLLNMALRSRVRRLVLWTLMNSLDSLSVSEICHKTRLYPSEVIGVIRGRPGSYESQYSLLRLRLVTEVTTKGHGDGGQKTYKFACKDQILLRYIEDTLKGYRVTGEA